MKSWLFALGLLILVWSPAYACEACGCGITLGEPGLLMQRQRSFVGLVSNYQAFIYPGEHTRDHFVQQEVWLRYALGSRWAFTARLPWHWHRREQADQVTRLQGLGDLRLAARYRLLAVQDSQRLAQQLFVQSEWRLPSSQLRAPTGSELPFRFFPGQGQVWQRVSLLHLLSLNDRWSLVSEGGYGHSLDRTLHYRLGAQANLSANLGYQWGEGRSRWSLWGGVNTLHQARDVADGYYRNDTGGLAAVGLASLQWQGQRISASLQGQMPLWQEFAENHLQSLPALQAMVQVSL